MEVHRIKIFLSWSGKRSQLIAEALRDWLPNVIQALKPWMSASDIEKGARWSSEVAKELEETRFGIICLTPENIDAPWIHFEAGALSKTIAKTNVCPCLFDLEPSDIKGPLVQFQLTKVTRSDIKKLLGTINKALDEDALPESSLDRTFDIWWPDLENRLQALPTSENKKPHRTEMDLLKEILDLARLQSKRAQEVKLIDLGSLSQENLRTLWTSFSDSRHRVSRIDDPHPDKECPKCGEKMTFNHDDPGYDCRKCGYSELA